ncbi:hypothetical protein [Caballeronia sp.]|jgi:hypothetical protein|uniref:hypothetical protein n=1 Tax=Caballeronia sp. TaxID=1931223 RepID=UPI0026180039|nr:hypothetical protein [Caballeronia sp.]
MIAIAKNIPMPAMQTPSAMEEPEIDLMSDFGSEARTITTIKAAATANLKKDACTGPTLLTIDTDSAMPNCMIVIAPRQSTGPTLRN